MRIKMKKIVMITVSIIILSVFTGCTNLETNKSEESSSNLTDSDGDGIPDIEDIFPFDPSEQYDSDQDYVGDNSDKFPNDTAASIDTDGDGHPDQWNYEKNQSDSTSNPMLQIDEFPDDPNEWNDLDGDGIGDNSDMFPNNADEWYDDDNDGIGDNSDINPSVNLSIKIKLDKFKVKNKVDILCWAQIYFNVNINGKRLEKVDNNDKFWYVRLDKEKEINYVLTYDIPDQTDERYTDIEIVMYDHDLLFSDDLIDINKEDDADILLLRFDNIENTIYHDGVSEGDGGVLWYDITYSESNDPAAKIYDMLYSWEFKDNNYELSVEIPKDAYIGYRTSNVDRMPQNTGDDGAMASFVTSNDDVVKDVAYQLRSFAQNENYNQSDTVNFILFFIQNNIRYTSDNESKGCMEYWRYPVETLVDKKGDCEDTSVLFASIMDALNYDVVLLFYLIDEDFGHLAVGINIEEGMGEYIEFKGEKYYYCETTTLGYKIGELPPDISSSPDDIIDV
jgi:hypothetical protein